MRFPDQEQGAALSACEAAGAGRAARKFWAASHGLALPGCRPAAGTTNGRVATNKNPDQGRGLLPHLVPEIGIAPTTYAFMHLPAPTRPQGTANFLGRD
ncbi:hypothetical protein D3C87_750980 [compost metagenome]